MTLSTKRFRSYKILKIDFAAESSFRTEQQLNGTQLLGLRLPKTPEVLNTIMVDNSIIFLMVHNTALNGWRFTSYDYRKLNRFTESEIWVGYTFWHKSGILAKFHHDLPRNFEYEIFH
jgi:hypothetical protein